MPKSSEITIKKSKANITIQIPVSLLAHVAKHSPNGNYVIRNHQKLAELVVEELKSGLGSQEGLTGLQALINEAIDEVYISGADCIYDKWDDKD